MSKVIKAQIWDATRVQSAISTLADNIVRDQSDPAKLALIGIRTRGEFIARRAAKQIEEKIQGDIKLGIVEGAGESIDS